MARSTNRFSDLIKNLGLALLNATLVLAILAGIAVGWAALSIKDFARSTAREVTHAAIESADLDPRTLVAELGGLNGEIKALRQTLESRTGDGEAVAALSERLDNLDGQIGLLTNPQEWKLSDAVIGRITTGIGGVLATWRDCETLSSGQSATTGYLLRPQGASVI